MDACARTPLHHLYPLSLHDALPIWKRAPDGIRQSPQPASPSHHAHRRSPLYGGPLPPRRLLDDRQHAASRRWRRIGRMSLPGISQHEATAEILRLLMGGHTGTHTPWTPAPARLSITSILYPYTTLFRSGNERLMEYAKARNPHHRLTTPIDVARCIAVLCQPGAYWMTGNTLRVDGGEGSVG